MYAFKLVIRLNLMSGTHNLVQIFHVEKAIEEVKIIKMVVQAYPNVIGPGRFLRSHYVIDLGQASVFSSSYLTICNILESGLITEISI